MGQQSQDTGRQNADRRRLGNHRDADRERTAVVAEKAAAIIETQKQPAGVRHNLIVRRPDKSDSFPQHSFRNGCARADRCGAADLPDQTHDDGVWEDGVCEELRSGIISAIRVRDLLLNQAGRSDQQFGSGGNIQPRIRPGDCRSNVEDVTDRTRRGRTAQQ